MTPRNEEQFKEIRDQRREQLRTAAIQVFSQKGFSAAKISDITSQANLSHGLFYHYFASKEEMYIEVIRVILNDFIEIVEEADGLSRPALGKMQWLTDITHSGTIQEGVYRHILVMQALYSEYLSEEVKHEIVALYKQAVSGISDIIHQGQTEGDFIEGDPHELATYHLSLAHGLLLWNAKTDRPLALSSDRVLRQLMKFDGRGGTDE